MEWLQEEELLLKNENVLPLKSMSKIKIYIYHIDSNKNIIHRNKELVSVDISTNTVSFDHINNIIKKYEVYNNKPYHIYDYFLYCIDVNEEQALLLSQMNNDSLLNMSKKQFIKYLQTYNNIFIPPSVSIFHSLNSIFLFFNELKCILKTSSNYTKKKKHNIHSMTRKTKI